MYTAKFKESVLWEDCPFCEEKNVIRRVSFSLEPDGEETQTNKKWGTPHYEFKNHITECQKIIGTFEQRYKKFSEYFQKKLVNKKFRSHAEV